MRANETLTSKERVDAFDAGDSQVLAALLQSLNDPSWQVRQAAVSEMTRRSDADAARMVVQAMRDNVANLHVLTGAIQILSQSGVETVSALAEVLHDPVAELRSCAALTLGMQDNLRAVPALLDALDDPDSNVRYHAIEALGKLRAAQTVAPLLAIVQAGDFSLTFPALDALVSIGDRRAAYHLLPLLEDELLQSAAIEAVASLGGQDAVPPLMALLNDATAPADILARGLVSLESKNRPIAGMVRQTISPRGIQKLIECVAKADVPSLKAIATMFGWLDDVELNLLLVRMLSRPEVHEEVSQALVRKGMVVVPLLLEKLTQSSADERKTVITILGRIAHADAVPALLLMLQEDTGSAVAAAGALAMIGDPRAFEPLVELLSHHDPIVRRAATSALNSLGHPSTAAALSACLDDPRPHLREAAVRVLAYTGCADLVELLLRRCQDEHESVRRAALEALASFANDERACAAISHGLRDASAGVRAVVARVLAQLDATFAGPLLKQALSDAAPWVRYFAVRSIAQQKQGADDELARMAQDDPAMQVRVAAIEAIGDLGFASAFPLLAELAGSAESDLACAALVALGKIGLGNAIPILTNMVTTSDAARRAAALRGLCETRCAEAAAILRGAALTGNRESARAAIAALERLALPEAVAALVELTALPSRRDVAMNGLSRCDPAFVVRGLEHAQVDVRLTVVGALARNLDERAVAFLSMALCDPDAAVRFAALDGLASRGGVDTDQLKALADADPDPSVCHLAQATLRRSC